MYHRNSAWVKREGNPLFDVTMGSYDAAEVFELLGLYLLSKHAALVGTKNVGFHRDDGLAVIHRANAPKIEKIRKDVIALLKSEALFIAINTNLIETAFLDVLFNLDMDKFLSYKKFNKIFNLSAIKISYSSMLNIKNLIKQHNSKFLSNKQDNTQRICNSTIKENCPLNGKCLYLSLVYKAEVTTNTTYRNTMECQRDSSNLDTIITHIFRHKAHINDTELSKYFWTLKENRTDYHLNWSIKPYVSRYKCGTRRCDLCDRKNGYCSSRLKSSIEQKN